MNINLARILVGLTTAGILAASGTSHAAGSAAFSLSPASANSAEGNTTSVAIYENGTSVSAVTATFTYDSSHLQFLSGSCAGAFSSTAASSSSSITCFVPGGNSAANGSSEVAVLNFTATATGTGSVTVNGSQIASNGVNEWNGSSATATVTIAAQTVTTPPAQSGPSTGSTSSTNNSSKNTSNSSTSPVTKPATTNNTTSPNGKTSSTASSVKGVAITKKKDNKVMSSPRSHHTGLVTSTLIGLLVVIFGVYWVLVRKRPEEAAPAVYKLNGTGSASKAVSKKSTKSHSRATAAKSASKKTTKKA